MTNEKSILLLAATQQEIQPLLDRANHGLIFDALVSGMGSAHTAYALGKRLTQKRYDVVINAGIAGSFTADIPIGEVCFVKSQQWGDVGYDDKGLFVPFFDTPLVNPLVNEWSLKEVDAVTVHTVSGSAERVEQLIKRLSPDIENMEGCAVFDVCLKEHIPFMEIRAVSNYVEPRDVSKWNIPLAIESLNRQVEDIIASFQNKER